VRFAVVNTPNAFGDFSAQPSNFSGVPAIFERRVLSAPPSCRKIAASGAAAASPRATALQ